MDTCFHYRGAIGFVRGGLLVYMVVGIDVGIGCILCSVRGLIIGCGVQRLLSCTGCCCHAPPVDTTVMHIDPPSVAHQRVLPAGDVDTALQAQAVDKNNAPHAQHRLPDRHHFGDHRICGRHYNKRIHIYIRLVITGRDCCCHYRQRLLAACWILCMLVVPLTLFICSISSTVCVTTSVHGCYILEYTWIQHRLTLAHIHLEASYDKQTQGGFRAWQRLLAAPLQPPLDPRQCLLWPAGQGEWSHCLLHGERLGHSAQQESGHFQAIPESRLKQ